MTKMYPDNTLGYANSTANTADMNYPEVPYTKKDFHVPCKIRNENNLTQVSIVLTSKNVIFTDKTCVNIAKSYSFLLK